MENFLNINETPPALDRSITNATNRLTESATLNQISYLDKAIRVETKEVSQNTNYKKFSGIEKVYQIIHGELVNNISKLTEIDKRTEHDSKNLKEVQNYIERD